MHTAKHTLLHESTIHALNFSLKVEPMFSDLPRIYHAAGMAVAAETA